MKGHARLAEAEQDAQTSWLMSSTTPSATEQVWDVLEDIPNDSAAALVLLEHHWAVPLRDAVVRAGGFRLSDGFISPLDLVELGLLSAEEAKDLHAMAPALSARSWNYPIGMMTMQVGWVRVTPWTYSLI